VAAPPRRGRQEKKRTAHPSMPTETHAREAPATPPGPGRARAAAGGARSTVRRPSFGAPTRT